LAKRRIKKRLLIILLMTQTAYALDIQPIRERRKDLKSLVHDIMTSAGARLSTYGDPNHNMFDYDNTLRGTDTLDFLIMDAVGIHVVYVSGSSHKQLNEQYNKYSKTFKRQDTVILYFDRYSIWERESGFIINTHLQFLRAMYSGDVTRADYDPIESVKFVIQLGKRLSYAKMPGIIELKPKVSEILERYVDGKGARLAERMA
jgi:hypothetical protein